MIPEGYSKARRMSPEGYSKARMFCLFSLFSLLVVPGICNLELEVKYPSATKCAIKGSMILLSGTYKNIGNSTRTDKFWTVNTVKSKTDVRVSENSDYKERVKELNITDEEVSFRLYNVRHEDEGKYCLRIVTKLEILNTAPCPGITLKVTELKVVIPDEVVEGESPVLTCKTTCNLASGTNFTWYKNDKFFSKRTGQNQLILQSVSSEDAGSYSCAVRDQKHLSSPALTLNVRYSPRNVSVSVNESEDSVILSCSSDSNPPAGKFNWFKEDQSSAVGSGHSFIALQNGRYYCEAHNPHGSQISESVSVLNFNNEKSISSSISITVGIAAAAFVVFVILIVFIWIKRKRVTPSQEQNHRGSPQHRAVMSAEDTYMTLDAKSRSSEYDTLDNMKRSSVNMPSTEDQEPVYYNIGK